MDQEPKRKRAPGGGRTAIYGEPVVRIYPTVSPEQRDKYLRLGGSAWLQQQIDSAAEPKPARKKAVKPHPQT